MNAHLITYIAKLRMESSDHYRDAQYLDDEPVAQMHAEGMARKLGEIAKELERISGLEE